jgi:hypothetical protein
MRRLFAGIAVLALFACGHGGSPVATEPPASAPRAPAVSPVATEGLVLPGGFSEQTTVADLQLRFGESNVATFALPDGSGRGVLLFPNDPTRRATVLFHDAAALSTLASVTVTGRGSRWRGKGGVHVGMSFAELRARNAKPFWFTGFAADHTGTVRNTWDVGALDVADGDQLYFGVDLRVRTVAPGATLPSAELQVSSDDPRYPKLGELVEVSALVAWSSLDDE